MILDRHGESTPFPSRMRPAPHVKLDGTHVAPIGTLRQQMHRATAPRPRHPPALSRSLRQAITQALLDDPAWAREIVAALRGGHA